MRIEERLARVEDALRPGVSETASTPGSLSNRRQSFETFLHPARVNHHHDSRRYFQHIVSVPHFDYSIRQTVGEAVTARPSILSFHCPYYIQFETWDDTRVFFDDELEAEEKLLEITKTRCSQGLDMTPRTVFQLQQNFVMNFLQWLPLLEVRAFAEHIELAQNDHFSDQSHSDCLVMFALAVGSLDRNRHAPNNLSLEEEVHPGLHYFHAGREILKTLAHMSRRNITTLQSRILQACYYLLILRPLLAWDVISEVARDCMHILSSGTVDRMEPLERGNFHRIFWICSVILHELEAVLKMHPIGLRQFHEIVPLPLTDHEDEGYYFFFAQASLRKLLTETLDVVGYRVGQVIYAPVVAAELCKQVDEWYAHLPAHVRFPVSTSPVFDLRKAMLRIQYLALHAVIFWPSVLQVLESGATNPSQPQTSPENLTIAQAEAKTCLENIQLVCLTTEELLMQSHLGLQFVIWASYANMCMALAMYRAPALAFIPETRNDVPIRKCFQSLHAWKDQKLVRRALKRSREHMVRLGILVD
jgi:hypothetical protein